MIKPELDPRIEPPHSFIVIFPTAASLEKAENWLLATSDHFSILKPTILAITIGLTELDLKYVINREGAFNFRIIEIDGFEIVDSRTEEGRLNEILDRISKSGYDFVPIEDRLFLRELSTR